MHLSNAWKIATQIPKESIRAGQEWKPSVMMFTALILVLTSNKFPSSVRRFPTIMLPMPTHWNWQLEISDWEFQSKRLSVSDLKQNLQAVRIWIMGLTHRMTTQTTPPSPNPLTPGTMSSFEAPCLRHTEAFTSTPLTNWSLSTYSNWAHHCQITYGL